MTYLASPSSCLARLMSKTLITKVHFSLIFGFKKGDPEIKRVKGYYSRT